MARPRSTAADDLPIGTKLRLLLGAAGLSLSLISILLALAVKSLATPGLAAAIIGIVLAAIAYGMDVDGSLRRHHRSQSRS
jgi:tetrahydromethanopterin S-methyltransferase subunit C